MADRHFSARTAIAREPSDVFAWVADHRNVPTVLEGITRWDPLGDRDRGRDARFDVAMSALGFRLNNVLVLDAWDEPRTIGWRSESGLIRQTGRWSFEPTPEGTGVTLSISYQPPAGLVGALLARQVEGLVKGRLQAALARMKDLLEAAADHQDGAA